MQLVCKSQSKILILQHSYVICLIRESGFILVMINAESSFLEFCFLLNPSLFKMGENFGRDRPYVCQLFLLPVVPSTMPQMDLQGSLGLASQGTLHNAGFCHHPSSSRCVPCLQLCSCSKHTPSHHHFSPCRLYHIFPKGESLNTSPTHMNSQLLCLLWLLLFPLQCWISRAEFT